MRPVTRLAPDASVCADKRRGTRAGRPATGGEAACPRSGPVEGVWGNREVPPGKRVPCYCATTAVPANWQRLVPPSVNSSFRNVTVTVDEPVGVR
jgi:hypothetical protein